MKPSSGARLKSFALAVEVRLPAEGRAFGALARRLTTDGVFVSTFHGVREGARVILELSLSSGPLLVNGVVARAGTATSAGFSVAFTNVPLQDLARLAAASGGGAQARA